MTKPLIGVVSRVAPSQLTLDAVQRAGGQPWPVSMQGTPQDTEVSEVLARVGALVLSDGPELRPLELKTGGNGAPTVIEAEVSLVRAALDVDMPVYGIGRGFQVLNIAQGGSIAKMAAGHAADAEHLEDSEGQSMFHHVYISPGSKLAAVVGSGGFVRVNSRHRFGVREAQKAELLRASAYCMDDGVIEALESPRHRWVIGVQFRPELRLEIPPHFDRLMQSLVERANERLHATNSP
ncbi:MAG: gamma-glutamyl-gamma-aminobutyrate hydrolase family protein [Chloroflexi bacterium]|nr:gamma-glutamyl-gamma-aminobutyrate hydrolase family protein [Chloroflexota bacterium]